MVAIVRTRFAHRHNKNGSWDSICKTCFRTVATENHEGELTHPEERHICAGFSLSAAHPLRIGSATTSGSRLTP